MEMSKHPRLQARARSTIASGHGLAVAALISVVLFTGCPYEGIPAGAPDPAAFEPRLLGEWEIREDTTSGSGSLAIDVKFLALTDAEYLLLYHDRVGCRIAVATGFMTRVGSTRFLNVGQFENNRIAPAGYGLFRVEMQGEDILLRSVAEDGVGEIDTPAQLREELARRTEEEALYDGDAIRLTRVSATTDASLDRSCNTP